MSLEELAEVIETSLCPAFSYMINHPTTDASVGSFVGYQHQFEELIYNNLIAVERVEQRFDSLVSLREWEYVDMIRKVACLYLNHVYTNTVDDSLVLYEDKSWNMTVTHMLLSSYINIVTDDDWDYKTAKQIMLRAYYVGLMANIHINKVSYDDAVQRMTMRYDFEDLTASDLEP